MIFAARRKMTSKESGENRRSQGGSFAQDKILLILHYGQKNTSNTKLKDDQIPPMFTDMNGQ